jgi:tetratricopeptide (TPR) repeat protein
LTAFGTQNQQGAPLDALACLQEGVQAARAGQLDLALESFHHGLSLAPKSAGLFLNRSIIHERLGNDKAVFEDLDGYLQFAPVDSVQNLTTLKRFIAFGVKLGKTQDILMRMQHLELLEQWQSAQFYEVLIGLLSLDQRSLEASLLHYLQRATELNCLTQSCLENALGIRQLQMLSTQPPEKSIGSVGARDILMQLALIPSAPQFILHLCLEDIAQYASNEDALLSESIDLMSLWIQVHPMDIEATEHLIQFLFKKNQFDLLENLFLVLSQRFPKEPNYLLGLSRARLFKRDLDRAFVIINAALDLDEKNLDIRLHRAKVFQQTLNPQLALVDINQNLQFDPNHIPSLLAKVNALSDLGRLDEALELIDVLSTYDLQAEDRLSLELDKTFIYRLSGRRDDWYAQSERLAQEHLNNQSVLCDLGWKKIHDGDWHTGFALLENRFTPGLHYFPVQPHILHAQIPVWSPEIFKTSLEGKHLLLCGEEGLGDIVQFIRFVPLLLARGLKITLMCKEALHPLLKFNFPQLRLKSPSDLIAELHSRANNPSYERYDVYGEIMSIPWVLGLSIQDLSGAPYLQVMPEKIIAMAALKQAKIQGKTNQLSIGLRWMSSLARSDRSVPLRNLAPLSEMPVNIFGLHYGPIKIPDQDLYQQWANFHPTELEMDDLAGLMMNLDCIITSDTMTAHLAGALGRSVILLKPCFIDWRWPGNDQQSIWYDSMRIIRQNQPKDWGEPIAELIHVLRERIEQNSVKS